MLVQTGYQCVGLGWDFKWLANFQAYVFEPLLFAPFMRLWIVLQGFWLGNGFNWCVVVGV